MLFVRGAHSSAIIHCNCCPFSKKACENLFESSPTKERNQLSRTKLLTNDEDDHHFGVLTWHDLSFQWVYHKFFISNLVKKKWRRIARSTRANKKCASNGSAHDKTRTNVHANTQRYTHKHTPSPKRVNEQTHTHTPSPKRVNEQTQTCTTVHAHKLRLAHTHTPVRPPRACARTSACERTRKKKHRNTHRKH